MPVGQRVADLLLLRERIAPRVGQTAFGGLEARRDAVEQIARTLREGVGEPAERRLQLLRDGVAGAALLVERAAPRGRHVGGGLLEAAGQRVELALHRARHCVAQRGHLLREPRHRRGDDRLQRSAGHARAFGGALLQRVADVRGKAAYARSVRSKKACWLSIWRSCNAALRASSAVIIVCSRSTSAGITSAWRCSSRNDSSR
jgi:hypothetical protein